MFLLSNLTVEGLLQAMVPMDTPLAHLPAVQLMEIVIDSASRARATAGIKEPVTPMCLRGESKGVGSGVGWEGRVTDLSSSTWD